MRILAPQDNALFMRYWRSRGRLESLALWLGLAFLISLLVVIGCFVSSMTPGSFHRVPWPRTAFGIIVALQALLLLVIGTASAGGAASSETVTGAMDFHRASATSYSNQTLGLLFGPTAVSYLCVTATLPAALLCVVLGGVKLLGFAEVLVSLFFTGLLFHVIAVAIDLRANKRSWAAPKQGTGALIFLVLMCLVGIPSSYGPFSLVGFLVGYPVIAGAMGEAEKIRSALFGVSLPPLLVQFVVQLPLLVVGALALRRAVAYTTRPPLSKRLSLALAFWLFVLFGCAVTNAWPGLIEGGDVVAGRRPVPSIDDRVSLEVAALIFAFLIGGAAGLSATPSYTLFCNGLRRRRKLNLTAVMPLEDAKGNSIWMLSYAALVAVIHGGLIAATGDWMLLLPLAAMLLSFGWLTAALEYHRLGPARGKGAVVPVVIGVLWVVLPVFAVMTAVASAYGGSGWAPWVSCMMSACPLFGISATSSFALRGGEGTAPDGLETTIVVLAVNFALFVFFAWLVASARRNAARLSLQESEGSSRAVVPSR